MISPNPLRLRSPRLAALAALAWPATLSSQYTAPPPPAAYALTGVTVVQADGRRAAGVTVVVRGGLIEALAPGLAPPPDAQVLEGDSLLVYPGMVDAQGAADFELPKVEINRNEVPFWAPPRLLQGMTPHRRVVDYLKATGSSTKDQRTKGIVAAGVHPTDGPMPGRGALLLFRKTADTPAELVLADALGPVMSFRGARVGYPETLFGVIAFERQSFEDAARHGVALAEYQRDPRGMTAPAWDPDYAVLRDATAGRVPVFFAADSAEDIRRVLSLADEYRFRPVIVGGADAWRMASVLKARDVAVLVSTDFPEPKRWKPKKADTTKADTTKEKAKAAEQEKPLDAAELREKESFENLWANAGRLAAAGVRVALTSGGGKGDLRKGARTAIEHGLAEGDALRAVTATPAALLGAPQLTRLEPGVAATFIVTSGPLFAEETRIAYTFVEGELEKGSPKKKEGPSEAPAVILTGDWDVEITSPQGSVNAKLTVKQEGSSFTGTMQTQFGPMRVNDGSVSGNKISFVGVLEMGGQTIEISFSGTAEGNQASGSGSGPFGALSWKATRAGGPGEEVAR